MQEYFEDTIKFNTQLFSYSTIKNENGRESIFVQDRLNKQKYFFKTYKNMKKEDYDFSKKIMKKLNENQFNTARLLFSKYIEEKAYYIYEFIEGKKFENTSKDRILLIKTIQQFHILTKDVKTKQERFLDRIENLKKHFPNIIHIKIISYISSVAQINYNPQIIISDINPTNMILYKNQIFLTDLEEVKVGEIEFDLARIYLNFFDHKLPIEKNSQEFCKMLNYLKHKPDLNKLVAYIILAFYYKQISTKKNYNINILTFFKNRNLIIKKMNNYLQIGSEKYL